jgi:hypothetical protein
VRSAKTPDFLLPNYNKCKNSDTLADRPVDPVQQNGAQEPAAGEAPQGAADARGGFVYPNDFSRLAVTRC